ncbi:MAG TPA: iron-containing redox enzyme family protein, partial [Planctomycetota bacterium]|nr:iron-containing redox enzyme family protein [Planctomycetota bacterium]
HGEGDLSRRHGATFLELLRRLAGLSQADVEARAFWPEVRAFNAVLASACVLDDWEIGAGCLGMIEHMFAVISARIGRALVTRGFLPEERVVHYSLHEELDVRHSDDFFAALRATYESDARGRGLVDQGLRLGAYVFDRLYRDLYAARARRRLAEVPRLQERIYAE